jgi:hypothetical protein
MHGVEQTNMTDKTKQLRDFNIFHYCNAQATGDGPFCWNCELSFDFNDAPPDLDMHFCNPLCEREWASRQPLANFLGKRRR